MSRPSVLSFASRSLLFATWLAMSTLGPTVGPDRGWSIAASLAVLAVYSVLTVATFLVLLSRASALIVALVPSRRRS